MMNFTQLGKNMIKPFALCILLLPLLLAGCTSISSEKIISPSGNEAYAISCGLYSQDCYKEAGKLCPNGYDIVNSGADNYSNNQGKSIQFHNMVVECK